MQLLKPKYLKILIPGCGLLALLLRWLMETTAIDDKGLLIAGHPTWAGLWVLTAAVVLVLLLGVRTIQGPCAYRDCFPGSMLAALGCVPALITPMRNMSTQFQSSLVFALISALAVISFVVAALCRMTEKKVPFLCHAAICVWFALKMLDLYQTWSFDPQLHDYCFQLFACIALTITAYQMACFDTGRGSHRLLWFWDLTAVYLCFACLEGGLFYAAGGVWALTNLTSLRIRRIRKTTEENV